MIHTPSNVDAYVRARMAETTPARRLQMASRMFSTARTLVKASVDESEIDERVLFFSRFYAKDFSKADCEKILASLIDPTVPQTNHLGPT